MEPNTRCPEYWNEEVRPLLEELNFAYRIYVPQSHAFFRNQGRVLNRTLLSNLIRYYVWDYLRSRGYEAVEENDGDPENWEMRPAANNGIKIAYKRSSIRVLRADPILGKTAEFSQEALFEKDEDDAVTDLLALYVLGEGSQYQGLLLTKPILERVGDTGDFKGCVRK